ncbi:DUF397 domain-containing protein [Nocardiopsis quinghaiensis]|uniref:DUF397 domain-containing protein n=1 Tax=Nocardiopsis quinghaiensis TaxID=464995 RepID=UPI0029584CF9|nr:DUF397 domain-containing protein [Nocardiopsis quinghaiensis]
MDEEKSSYSAGIGGNRVEVADLACGLVMHDSKRPAAGYLPLPTEWSGFLGTVLPR